MRVMIADDTFLVREGLSRILSEAGFRVTGSESTGDQLFERAIADPPDVVITDLRMPPSFSDEGIVLAEKLRMRLPGVAIMLLSQYVEVRHAVRLMEEFSGRVGYLLKDRVIDLTTFASDLRRVAAGEVVIDSDLITRLVARRGSGGPIEALSSREREVLELMAQGRSNSALAAELFVTQKTVEGYIRSIFTKLDLETDEASNRRVLAVLKLLRGQ